MSTKDKGEIAVFIQRDEGKAKANSSDLTDRMLADIDMSSSFLGRSHVYI